MEHVLQCEFAMVECPDCKETMLQKDLLTHQPVGAIACPNKPYHCYVCDRKMKHTEVKEHNGSEFHVSATMRRSELLVGEVEKLAKLNCDLTAECTKLAQRIADMQLQQQLSARQFEEKMIAFEQATEKKLAELRASSVSIFVEFDIFKWSDIREVALFSTNAPVKAWGHEWWLKVEKTADRVGLYLCCGEEGRFPVSVDYQLMVRKRNADEAVCASAVFRTDFGKEKAWGLSRFSDMKQLEEEGAYDPSEDKITFGCLVYPIKGLQWGRTVRWPVSHPPPATATSSVA